jgi:tetratricopeptide (TPR) repeat protein
VYEALGDNDAAQHAYKKAIDANPNNCAAYVDLGVLSRRAGDFLSAEANYLACTQRVPNFREAYLNLGILYELYLGRLDDALQAYQTYQTLSEDPDMRVAGWVSDLERRIAGNES